MIKKKVLIPFMAVAAISVAAPAAAQHYGPPRGPAWHAPQWAPIASRTHVLERKIDIAYRARVMSTGKAREFRRDIANLVRLEHQYRARGMSMNQRHDLERRYQRIDQSLDRYVQRARYRR